MSPHAIRCVTASDDETAESLYKLHFAMLGCEPHPPYGPNEHTAELLLKSLVAAAEASTTPPSATTKHGWEISIDVYNVQNDEYPENYNVYDGFLLPGSFSSAYDPDEWIQKLKTVIQEQIVQPQRPTLAICFGHQILAHSFFSAANNNEVSFSDRSDSDGGAVIKTPTGPRAGKHSMTLTSHGSKLLLMKQHDDDKKEEQKQQICLYYTHGDMVERLPPIAVSLGGCDNVPIHSAAYYCYYKDADDDSLGTPDAKQDEKEKESKKPFAISIQAHPEYPWDNLATLEACMDAMEQHGAIDSIVKQEALQTARDSFSMVQQDSLMFLVNAGRALGWFPTCPPE